MEYKIFLYLAILLAVLLTIAWIADIIELKKFRENLVPGMSALIKIDDVWCVAKVTKIYHDTETNYTSCNLDVMIDEVYYQFNMDINHLYKPNSYRI